MYNVGNKDNTYKLINLSWQIRLIKQLIHISLINSISSIIISVLVRVFSTLSFLLPLKALLIMASQEVPKIVLSYWSSATISSFGSLLIFLSAISFILLLKLEDWKKYYIGLCTDDFKTALQKHSSTVNIVAETSKLLSMIISTIAFGIFSLFLFSILYFVDVNLFFFMMIILGSPITWIILSRRKLFGENLDYTNEFISPQNIKLYSVFAFFSTFVFLAFPLAFSLDFSADKSYHSTLILMISFVISRQLINSGIGYVKGGIDLYHNKINLVENYLYDDLKATSQKSDNKIMPVPPVEMNQRWLQFDELGLVSEAKLLKSNIKGMSFFTGSLADLDRSVLLKKFTGKKARLIAEHDRNFSEDMFKLTGNSLVPKFLDKTEMDDNIVCAAYEIDSKDAFDRITNEDLLNYLRTLITVDPKDCSIGMRLEKSERPFHRRLAPAHYNKLYHTVTCEKEFSDLIILLQSLILY